MKHRRAVRTARAILGYHTFFRDWKGDRPDPEVFVRSLPDLTPSTFLNGLYSKYASQFGAARWGDKSPIYSGCMGLLADIFPDAHFVHIIRDGRDVALSMLRAYRENRFFYVDLYYATQTWKHRVLQARSSGQRLGPERYREIRYEQLTANPESVLREICWFLGESYFPAMSEPHRIAPKHYHSTGIHLATRQPPNTGSVGRWRSELTPSDERLVMMIAGDLLKDLGYDQVPAIAMGVTERLRYIRLRTKYAMVAGGRALLKSVGIFHPTWLLSRRL